MDGTVKVWDLTVKTRVCQATLSGHIHSVNAVAISPDIAASLADGSQRFSNHALPPGFLSTREAAT